MKKYVSIILALLVFILIWQLVSMLISRPFLPSPIIVMQSLIRLGKDGRLWGHLGSSISRIAWALLISSIPAMILGLLAGRSVRLNNFISPIVYLLHPLPKAAFLPVIMLFFGIGEVSKIFLISFIIFSQMLVAIRDSAKQITASYIDSVRSLGAGKINILKHVIIPAIVPAFFTGFRVSLGTAIAVLFFAETFASDSGLGFLIVDAWTRIAYPEMYSAIMALSILGLLLFIITDLLEYILCPWTNR